MAGAHHARLREPAGSIRGYESALSQLAYRQRTIATLYESVETIQDVYRYTTVTHMDKDTVAALKQLHEQLLHAGPLGESDKRLVEQLQTDIQFILGSSENISDPQSRPVHEQMKDAIQRFEVTHPDLTAVMARLINQLSDLGI